MTPSLKARSSADAAPFRPLPARAGLGLKPQHVAGLLAGAAEAGFPVGFLEVHAENYMGAGGPLHAWLARLRAAFPLSIHGVGLSIGGAGPLDDAHLDRLATLLERHPPAVFSEHLAWSSHDGTYLNDLLPIAYDGPTLARVAAHVDAVQSTLRRPMLLENPSTYVAFAASDWDEVEFIAEVSRRTGCGLLLDVNNVAVTCANHGRDPIAYLDAFPVEKVGEIHLGGYAETNDSAGAPLRIDAHGSAVAADVWALYRHALARTGPVATLIEWDNDVPALDVLLAEAARAEACLAAEAARRNHGPA